MRIGEEIHEHVGQVLGIGRERRQVCVNVRPDRDPIKSELGGQQVERLHHQDVDPTRLERHIGTTGDTQEPVHDRRRPLRGLPDRLQIGRQVLVALLIKLFLGQLGIPADNEEGIVQLMRHAAQENAQSGQLVLLPRFLLTLLARGHVPRDALHTDDGSIPGLRGRRKFPQHIVAGLRGHAQLKRQLRFPHQDALEAVSREGDIIRMQQGGKAFPDPCSARPAGHGLKGVVQRRDGPVCIKGKDHVLRRFHQALIPLVRKASRGLRLFALGAGTAFSTRHGPLPFVPRLRHGRSGSTEEGWLGDQDSNLGNQIQSLMSYH